MKEMSKFLSFVLRHQPQAIGLALDESGWADVGELIDKAAKAGKRYTPELIAEIVATSDKKRFTLSEDGTRIRAAQGHSVDVDLGLTPVVPPPLLYHGTATRFLESIRAQGLRPGSRQQVHLSGDVETARKVGMRHGSPAVLVIQAVRMHDAGFAFYRADNGVWLTDHVPHAYIEE